MFRFVKLVYSDLSGKLRVFARRVLPMQVKTIKGAKNAECTDLTLYSIYVNVCLMVCGDDTQQSLLKQFGI